MWKPAALALGLAITCGLAAPGPTTMPIWPGPAPGEAGTIGEETATKLPDGAIRSLTNVRTPTITVYRPESPNGLAMVVCPGGGYSHLAWDHEGEQVARWLNGIGVTAVLLKYRVPRREGTPKDRPPPQALMDAQRALGLTRAHASEWGIDPSRIGILGFSAGGHLAAWASTSGGKRNYEPVDDADKADCRPDFAVVIYPGGVVRRGTSELTPEIRVDDKTPPMFVSMSDDDPVGPQNAVQLYLALRRAGVPAELHIYADGGHGYGLRKTASPSATWPSRVEDWLRARKLLGKHEKE